MPALDLGQEGTIMTRYITLGKIRLVFRDGKYHGWYRWK